VGPIERCNELNSSISWLLEALGLQCLVELNFIGHITMEECFYRTVRTVPRQLRGGLKDSQMESTQGPSVIWCNINLMLQTSSALHWAE
jgi:hypothetical protein